MKNFKTYGDVFESLKADLKVAFNQAFQRYYGTPDYFASSALMIHRAYQDWCYIHEIEDMAGLRKKLRSEMENYPQWKDSVFRTLFYSTPNEFNVRGVWVPEENKISVDTESIV